MILSRETNPVVNSRGRKLDIEVFQSVYQKDQTVQALLAERDVDVNEVVFIGNDLTDLVVLPYVGFFACPADAHPQVLRQADLVLNHAGGQGAVRELVEIILEKTIKKEF